MSGPGSSHAVIVGLGRTGLSCARHLHARGVRLAVTDTRAAPPGVAELQGLDPSIPVRLNGLDAGLLTPGGWVVTSPGVPLDDPFFAAARALGLPILGDVELFAREVTAPVAGITGTNGKSTVTTLLGRMAQRAGRATRIGGNLGEPALELLAQPGPVDLHVLELSSFQLQTTDSLRLKVATLLNLTPDHLDRHGSMEAYGAAKARIFRGCGTAVINLDDPRVPPLVPAGVPTLGFSLNAATTAPYTLSDGALRVRGEAVLPLERMKIRGLHNAANALAALASAEGAGLPLTTCLEELTAFPGLPHRCEWVAERHGVTFINDSKGTNVGATLAAVGGLSGPLLVIAGGDGKGQDFTPLAQAFRGIVRHTLLIGRDAPALAQALTGVCGIHRCGSLEEAVSVAAELARPGDTVLLSPACASLDMFRDYAHRGRVFAAAVAALPA